MSRHTYDLAGLARSAPVAEARYPLAGKTLAEAQSITYQVCVYCLKNGERERLAQRFADGCWYHPRFPRAARNGLNAH